MKTWTISLLILLSAMLARGEDAAHPGRRVAVLVGVNLYDGAPLQKLNCCENDVNELARILESAPYSYDEVILMTHASPQEKLQPTAANIRAVLDGVQNDARPLDTLLLAFSGHGTVLKRDWKKAHGPENDDFYYCPLFANLKQAESDDADAAAAGRKTLLSIDEVYAALKRPARSRILLMDSCRSEAHRGDAQTITAPLVPEPPAGSVALFSCGFGHVSFEEKSASGHGYMFKYLIEGMKGNEKTIDAYTGQLTWAKLVAYVKEEVPHQVKQDWGEGKVQIPDFKGEDHGLALAQMTLPEDPVAKVRHEYERKIAELEKALKQKAPSEVVNVPGKKNEIEDSLTLDLGGGVKMELVRIPHGTFTMGSPANEAERPNDETQHQVTIGKDFYMAKFAVTQDQYEAMMGTNPSNFKGMKNPVEGVSWNDAQEFCKKLAAKTGKRVQLPTEAQWEYACRAGTKTRFYTGDDESDLARAGWYSKNSDGRTHPAGGKAPNSFGLYHMHGNVWQWCQDVYKSDYEGLNAPDPVNDPAGDTTSARVLRGGSWNDQPALCRSAFRNWLTPAYRSSSLGFRCVLPLD